MIKIQQFPSLALKNKNRLNNSNMAGCFGCLKIFKANEGNIV